MTKLIASWLPEANRRGCHFPLNNLPYGVFSARGNPPRCGIALGSDIVDPAVLAEAGLLEIDPLIFQQPHWNAFMTLGPKVWLDVRSRLIALFRESGEATLREQELLCRKALVPMSEAELHKPFSVTEFTDFFSSWHHAFNAGSLFRSPEDAVPPNWKHMPIGYNGRASSVVGSGSKIRRPWGQLKHPDQSEPVFEPSRKFDFELELGAIVGTSTNGPLTAEEADGAIFGYILLNDWSARDIQTWESRPLGPFQSKATATTVGNWIVSKFALEPSRTGGGSENDDLLAYLQVHRPNLYDIDFEVTLTPDDGTETTITRSNHRNMYFSAAQQIAHHTSSGCPMRVGDLLGSGTISGPTDESLGCLLELSQNGNRPLKLQNGAVRRFLDDGDSIRITGIARQEEVSIGFGDCEGQLLSALHDPYFR
ncbi:fumarylacetoacetase [Martelella sp. FOR1707]